MNLNKNNYFARYYNWICGYYPPDICSFFWGTLFIILISPFLVPGKLIHSTSREYEYEQHAWKQQVSYGLAIWALTALVTGFGNAVIYMFGYEFKFVWSIIIGGIFLGLLSIAVIAALIIGIMEGARKISKRKKKAPTGPTFGEKVSMFWGAIRGKYCTKITWRE